MGVYACFWRILFIKCNSTNNSNVSIPDNDSWILTLINIAGINQQHHLFHMDVIAHIDHDWVGDLEIVLTDPNNDKSLGLVDRAGHPFSSYGNWSNLGELILFTDYATTYSENMGDGLDNNDIITGDFKPSWFTGLSFDTDYQNFIDYAKNYNGVKNGDWMFWVRDKVYGVSGVIRSVSFNIGTDRYCVPFMNNLYEHITNVSFANLNYNSGKFEKSHPDYRTIGFGQPLIPVSKGQTYPIAVSISASSKEYIYLFIDWNQDGDFEDSDEIYPIASNVSTNGPHTLSITIPTSANLGETRMRVFLGYNDITPNSCLSGDGEVEDFTLLVQDELELNEIFSLNSIMYPNPVEDMVYFTSKNKMELIQIYTMEGKEVYMKKVKSLKEDLNLAALPAGNY